MREGGAIRTAKDSCAMQYFRGCQVLQRDAISVACMHCRHSLGWLCGCKSNSEQDEMNEKRAIQEKRMQSSSPRIVRRLSNKS